MEKLKPLVIKLSGDEKYQRLLSGRPETAGIRSGLVNLKPKEEIGQHSTEEKEEALVILNGKAEVSCDNYSPLIIEKNCLVYIPPNTMHNVKNVGIGLLRYVYIVS